MGIVAWIVWGLVAGATARLLLPGRQRVGLLATIAIGVAGSLLGGWIATGLLGIGDGDRFDFGSFVIAVIGSVALLALYRALAGDRGRGSGGELDSPGQGER